MIRNSKFGENLLGFLSKCSSYRNKSNCKSKQEEEIKEPDNEANYHAEYISYTNAEIQ